jgi:type IV pilus assembly protein PilW
MTYNTKQLPYTALSHQRGVSLIEVMVAITISLMLLAGLVTIMTNTSHSYGETNKASRQLENGRYTMQLLKESIQHTGFYGEHYLLADPPGALPDPCATAAGTLEGAMPLAIQGYDAPSALPSPLSNCLSDANHVNGTDILVIRRASTTSTAMGSLDQGRVYLQSRADDFVLAAADDGTNNSTTFNLLKADATTSADIRDYRVEIYFISPCNVPSSGNTCTSTADNGSPIPTLKRIILSRNVTATALITEPLVEGIEDLQIEYGIDRSGNGIPNESTSGANNEYITAPALADWENVMSVRLFVLVRNTTQSTAYTDAKTYTLGQAGPVGPFNDAFKRHLFSSTIRLVNPSGRRES